MTQYTIQEFAPGDEVHAFNPRKFGVIDTARVTKVGRKWLYVDFGPINGNIMRISPRYITEHKGSFKS